MPRCKSFLCGRRGLRYSDINRHKQTLPEASGSNYSAQINHVLYAVGCKEGVLFLSLNRSTSITFCVIGARGRIPLQCRCTNLWEEKMPAVLSRAIPFCLNNVNMELSVFVRGRMGLYPCSGCLCTGRGQLFLFFRFCNNNDCTSLCSLKVAAVSRLPVTPHFVYPELREVQWGCWWHCSPTPQGTWRRRDKARKG